MGRRRKLTVTGGSILAAGLAWCLSIPASAQTPMIRTERIPYTGPPVIVRHVPAPPPPATADDLENAVSDPVWAVAPTPSYPEIARAMGVTEAGVELVCDVVAEGRIGACRTVRETHQGVGFAAAVDAAMREARLHPGQAERIEAGSRIRFRFRFRLD